MKITYMGKRVRDNNGRFSSFKLKVKLFFRKLFRLSMLGLAIYSAFLVGRYIAPTETITNIVQADNGVPPVMQRIAKCESGNTHFDKNGQILVKGNVNKTVDIGKYQVNNFYWGAKARELGLDITKEKDNEEMALWIYENKGTQPWYSSQNCWNK